MCNLKEGELCVVVTDAAYNPVIGDTFVSAALDMGAEAYTVVLPYARPIPTRSLLPAWKEIDLLIYPTTNALHQQREMREALDSGLRALMAVQPLQVLERLVADPDVIRRTKAGAKLLAEARTIRISSDAGTDLVMDKTGRGAVACYGAADEPGHLDFWGSGMVETAQLEGTLEGQLVLDTGDIVFHLGRYVEQPVTITFREGRAVGFEGGVDAFLIKNHLESFHDPNALMAGHTSWGTDPRALWSAQAIQFPQPGAGGGDRKPTTDRSRSKSGVTTTSAFAATTPPRPTSGCAHWAARCGLMTCSSLTTENLCSMSFASHPGRRTQVMKRAESQHGLAPAGPNGRIPGRVEREPVSARNAATSTAPGVRPMIRRDRLVKTFLDLVAIPSPSEREQRSGGNSYPVSNRWEATSRATSTETSSRAGLRVTGSGCCSVRTWTLTSTPALFVP